ncbi:MAG TPA: penicillin acylase family protein [Spirochaetota bacterium]|nr:penicillin acylase family protein [Spirochaetota bacterium]
MNLRRREAVLGGKDGDVRIRRMENGVPRISANTLEDLIFGLGWIHSCDRQLQTLLMRVVLRGEAAEHLRDDPELIRLDTYIRRMNFVPDPEDVLGGLDPDVRRQLELYAEGFNLHMSENGVVPDLRVLGYRPPQWTVFDTLLIGKAFGFIGLADIQGKMEKFIVQLIKKGIEERKLRELFPYLEDSIDYDLIGKLKIEKPLVPDSLKWFREIPKLVASNNWAVSGKYTKSGKPLICGDIHLQINRLPSIWQEVVMVLPDNKLAGATIPGTPGLIIGRTDHVAWSPTYSFMDMLDYRIEHCREGKYRRPEGWREFQVREEVIRVKKKSPVTVTVYENEDGVLEGAPEKEGYYLLLSWSAKYGCGACDFDAMLSLPRAKSAEDAMNIFRRLDVATFNWVFADTGGNIGYQMSGRCFRRTDGRSGLVPVPAWEKKHGPDGWVEKDRLPSLYDPQEGFIITANQDLNNLGRSRPINLPMAPYRAERIRMLIEGRKNLTVEDMKEIQYDLFSVQADRYMGLLGPLIPDTKNGRIFREWDRRYDLDSRGATLFESVYKEILRKVFGEKGFGRDVFEFLVHETGFFHDYYGNLDNIVFNRRSSWWEGMDRDEVLREAVGTGLNVKAKPYGRTRKMTFSHLIFGGKLPRFLGFDYGPVKLPGSRATISQGQILRSTGRTLVVAPSFRMIADMSNSDLHANLAGGASDRRFSRWYKSDIRHWIRGDYKTL